MGAGGGGVRLRTEAAHIKRLWCVSAELPAMGDVAGGDGEGAAMQWWGGGRAACRSSILALSFK